MRRSRFGPGDRDGGGPVSRTSVAWDELVTAATRSAPGPRPFRIPASTRPRGGSAAVAGARPSQPEADRAARLLDAGRDG